MKKEYVEYLKGNYNVDPDKMSKEDLNKFLKDLIEYNKKQIYALEMEIEELKESN